MIGKDWKEHVVFALEAAWGIIANASGSDWSKETPEWQKAAANWRDHYWHPFLDAQREALDVAAELEWSGPYTALAEKIVIALTNEHKIDANLRMVVTAARVLREGA
jgi:hypothetical protein